VFGFDVSASAMVVDETIFNVYVVGYDLEQDQVSFPMIHHV